MPEYRFITGEVFSIMANDEEHARRIIDAYFSSRPYEYDDVEPEDIDAVQYIEGTTIKLDSWN